MRSLNSRRRYALIGFVFVLLLLGLVPVSGQSGPVFRIGILDDERGPISNGARLAALHINQAGGVVGADGTVFQLELVIQPTDGGARLTEAVTALRQADLIAVLGPTTTEEVLGNMAALQSLNLPVLTPATGDTILAADSTDRLFRTRAAELLQGQALANYLVNELGIQRVTTVQMDLESTASVVGLSTALAALGVAPQAVLYEGGMTIDQLTTSVIAGNPQIAVAFGPPDVAGQLYNKLRELNWSGLFAYYRAMHPDFHDRIAFSQLEGIISATTWPSASTNPTSDAFLNAFVRAFGYVPGPIEAASYDAVNLIAEATGLPGALQSSLTQINNFVGVQGTISPARLGRGETSDNVAIVVLGPLGGQQINARFAAGQRLPDEGTPVAIVPIPTPTGPVIPTATATPQGVVLTIKSSVQNVRGGPGLEYDILGQMSRDEQAQVIGATADFSWVVIQYRGQQGWLATYLLDVAGNRATVPVIAPPPTPTPPPATETPTAEPYPDIVVIEASPRVITIGSPFNITVTVKNQGPVNSGQYAIATNFQPDGLFSGTTLPGLGAGQQTTLTLGGTLNGAPGIYEVAIVADLNQEVNEGTAGEANNFSYQFRYRLDRPVINSGTLTLNPGSSFSLEGAGTADVRWTNAGDGLRFPQPPAGSGMYIITGVASMNEAHYGLIHPELATTHLLDIALLPNTYIGIVTAEGNLGIIHVDSVVAGGTITLSYRVYA